MSTTTYQEKKEKGLIEFRPTGPNAVAIFEANFSSVDGTRIADNHYVVDLELLQQDINVLVERREKLDAEIADFQLRYDDAKAAIETEFPAEGAG